MTIEAVLAFVVLCFIFGMLLGFIFRCLKIGKVNND